MQVIVQTESSCWNIVERWDGVETSELNISRVVEICVGSKGEGCSLQYQVSVESEDSKSSGSDSEGLSIESSVRTDGCLVSN